MKIWYILKREQKRNKKMRHRRYQLQFIFNQQVASLRLRYYYTLHHCVHVLCNFQQVKFNSYYIFTKNLDSKYEVKQIVFLLETSRFYLFSFHTFQRHTLNVVGLILSLHFTCFNLNYRFLYNAHFIFSQIMLITHNLYNNNHNTIIS